MNENVLIESGILAQEKLALGVNKLADLVKLTLGPKGKNVVIDRKFAPPLVTNDGVTIAREVVLKDYYENVGAKLIKEVSSKANDIAGDGTTTATVLAQKILNEGLKLCNNNESPILLNKGIELAVNFCTNYLKQNSKKIKNSKDIENVATISCQDPEIGKLLALAYDKLGKNTTIVLQDSQTAKTTLTFQEGVKIDKGFTSPYFCNNPEKNKVEFGECLLLLTDLKLTTFKQLLPLLEQIIKTNLPLLIVCDDIEEECLSGLIINKMRGNFNCCVVKAPFYGDKKLAFLEDIAALTNTMVVSNTSQKNLENITIDDLGKLKQVKVGVDYTTIVSRQSNNIRLKLRKDMIEQQISDCTVDYDKEQLKLRLSNLVGGIATIMVGSTSDVEQKEKKLRIEDAISSTTSALELGIVPGGGIALVKLQKPLDKFIKKIKDETIKKGAQIIKNSLSEPLRQILKNANIQNEVMIIEKIKKSTNQNFGYDAMKNTYCNMLESGIIDPTKVTLCALELSASVVKMILTTQGIITEVE